MALYRATSIPPVPDASPALTPILPKRDRILPFLPRSGGEGPGERGPRRTPARSFSTSRDPRDPSRRRWPRPPSRASAALRRIRCPSKKRGWPSTALHPSTRSRRIARPAPDPAAARSNSPLSPAQRGRGAGGEGAPSDASSILFDEPRSCPIPADDAGAGGRGPDRASAMFSTSRDPTPTSPTGFAEGGGPLRNSLTTSRVQNDVQPRPYVAELHANASTIPDRPARHVPSGRPPVPLFPIPWP
jgi:hypothetical protein